MNTDELVIIRTEEDIYDLQQYLQDKQFISFDTETTGVTKGSEIIGYSVCADVNKAFYVITHYWDKGKQQLIDLGLKDASYALLDSLRGKSLIMHNAVFDCSIVKDVYSIDLMPSVHTDTMILAHLVNENRSVGLKDLGVSIYGESAAQEQKEMKESVTANGGVLTKEKYELYKGDADLIAKYGAKDTILTLKLFYELLPSLFEQGLDKFFYEDESMPLLRGPTYELNTSGLKVDQEALQKLRGELEAECIELEAFVYKEIDSLVKDKYPGTKKSNKFNINSNVQIAWLLFGKMQQEFGTLTDGGREVCRWLGLKLPYSLAGKRDFIKGCMDSLGQVYAPPERNKKTGKMGRPKTVGEPWKYLKCDKGALSPLAKKYKWVDAYQRKKKSAKLLDTYVLGIQKKMSYGIIRPNFLQHGTTSGRYSCIAEGQWVSMPGGDKPIEQVKVGDVVYCYSDDGTPSAAHVKAVYDNGVQDCVELHWRSQGSHQTGSLICTPDHRLKTRDRGWVEAADIRTDERIFHLRRGANTVNGRMRVYGADYFQKNEEQLLKEQLFGESSRMHAHHKNGDKTDNRVENLEVLSAQEHLGPHAKERANLLGAKHWGHLHSEESVRKRTLVMPKGQEHYKWVRLTRFGLLRLLAKARGKVTKLPFDFQTIRSKAALLGIDLWKIRQRYNSKGQYLSRAFLMKILSDYPVERRAMRAAGVDFYKFRRLCREYGLETNHKVTHKTYVGQKRVYDLEVETHHNFIVNELCVHNCKNPNFQNLPKKDKRIKSVIVSRPGKVFVGADYDQLEPRVFASVSGDQKLLACFESSDDFYSVIGAEVFDKYDCNLVKDAEGSFSKKYPALRDIAKVVALSSTYGTTAPKMAPAIGKSIQEAQEVIDAYFERFPDVKKMMADSHQMAMQDGQVTNLFGRPRRMPQAKEFPAIYGKTDHADLPYEVRNALNLAVNHRIQSSGASIMNRAAIAIYKAKCRLAEANPKWLEVRFVLQVHDEVILEGPQQLEQEMIQVVQDCMENTITLPGVSLKAAPKSAKRIADLKD